MNQVRRPFVKRLLVCVLLVACFTAPVIWAQDAPQDTDATPLAPGQTIGDSLASGDVHAYTVDLAADQFVYGEAHQQTVDVVVTVYGPDGTRLGTYDAPRRGPEPFQFSSKADGTHRIEVKPFEQKRGRYEIALERVEPVASAPEERVDQLMVAYDGEDVPGAVVAVFREGEVAFSEGYGMANLAHGIPITPETRFNLGSISKQFLGFAFALLAEQGKLSLDDPVRTYLSDWPQFEQTVRLRHLLTHTSGYREAYGTLALAGRIPGRDFLPREEALEVVRRQPELEFPAGSDYQYNSTAYVILAEVFEQVTGTPARKWVEKNIFDPLGMEHTTIEGRVGEIIPGAAQSYTNADEGGYNQAFSNRAIFGAAEVYTTVGDLAKWLRNFHTAELGGSAVQERMREPFVLTTGDTTDYALGLRIDEHRGLRRISHTGGHAGYRALLTYYPGLDAGVAVMSNYGSFPLGDLPENVVEAFLGDHMTEEPKRESEAKTAGEHPAPDEESWTPSEADRAAYTGRYFSEELQTFYTVAEKDSGLVVQHRWLDDVKLTPTEEDTFGGEYPIEEVVFTWDEAGQVTGLTVSTGRTRGVRFEKRDG